jgi:hypothetical protein
MDIARLIPAHIIRKGYFSWKPKSDEEIWTAVAYLDCAALLLIV